LTATWLPADCWRRRFDRRCCPGRYGRYRRGGSSQRRRRSRGRRRRRDNCRCRRMPGWRGFRRSRHSGTSRQLLRRACGGARDGCSHAWHCKQQEREDRSKRMTEPATLRSRSGGCWRVVLPSTPSLDPWCSPAHLPEREHPASSRFPGVFHVCLPLSASAPSRTVFRVRCAVAGSSLLFIAQQAR
jgi:hypothetical protein